MARTGKRRGLLLLLIFLVVASAAAIAQDYRFDQSIAAGRDTAASLDRDLAQVQSQLNELRLAQTGYVATGQTAATWMTKAAGLITQINSALDVIKTSTNAADVRAHLESVTPMMTDLGAADTRARNYVTGDQLFLASDVIYVDASDLHHKIATELDQTRSAAASSNRAHVASLTQMRFAMNAGIVALGLIAAVVLFKAAGSSDADMLEEMSAPPSRGLSLQDAMPSVAPTPTPARLAPTSVVNLAEVADLCGDFSRLQTGQDMPRLLDRTAKVLDAKGLILWVIDTGGKTLRPLFGNGYGDKVMQRLGSLQVDAENVTCLAYRSKQAQVIDARTADACGAIAVPLVTPSGCIGVLSAEVKRAKPDKDTLSAAKMIAAQMAALAAPMGESTATQSASATGN